eukprot:m.414025 g.414025  ORF g.414025 m.414025 type:complete len:303 (+) comp56586_c0_seq1:53-961(+)
MPIILLLVARSVLSFFDRLLTRNLPSNPILLGLTLFCSGRYFGGGCCCSLGLASGGCQELDLTLWDIENTTKPIFKAKNVKHDELDLRVPVFVTDLTFVQNSGDQVFATTTAAGQLRMYDFRIKTRPTHEIKVSEHLMTALTSTRDGNLLFCGDAQGYIYSYDVRTMKQVGGYKGAAASCRSLQAHPSLPFIASCGLDRFVRVHNSLTRKPVVKAYLKQQLNCVLFSKEHPIKQDKKSDRKEGEKTEEDADDAEEEDVDDDSLWDSMRVVEDAPVKRKGKNAPSTEPETAAAKAKRPKAASS